MSDGHGPTPETPPPGWAAEQPPPYGASPWAAPGAQPPPPPPSGQPYGQQPPPPPPQGQQPYHYPQQPPPPPGYGYMPPPPALRPGIIPLRPLTLGDLLDGTIKLVRSNPKAVLGLSAVAALLASVPLAIGQALMLGSMGDLLTNPQAAANDPGAMFGTVVTAYGSQALSLLISFIVVTLLTGVLTRILGRAVFGGKITAGEAWHLVKGRIGALFAVVLMLTGLALAPLVIIVPLFLLLTSMVSGDSAAVGGLVVLGIVVLLLYVAYLLFINARFAFATPVVVLEGRGPVEALRRSWQLVTGDFWRVLGILLLTSLLAGLVSAVLSVPFSLIGTFVGMLGGGGTGAAVLAAVMIALGSTLGAMITYPLQAGVAGLLYADRRMRSEAFDLVLQTAAIEQQRQGWVPATADELWHPSNAARS